MQRHQLVSWLATTTLAFTTIAGCVTDEEDALGDVGLNLVATSPSGNTYVLRNAEITVAGPGGTIVFRTEDDPFATRFTGHVAVGQYTADLSDGWRLDRIGADGVGVPVVATLISPDPAAFEVLADTNTNVPLRFRTDGDIIDLGQGDFDIVIDVDDAPTLTTLGVRTPLGNQGISPNYLIGSPVDVPANATLRQLGYYSHAGQSNVKLALYRDVGGVPVDLVAQVGPVAELTGDHVVDMTAQPLVAGRYWVFAIFDTTSGTGTGGTDSTAVYKYISLPFGSDLPTLFPASHSTDPGVALNLFITVSGL